MFDVPVELHQRHMRFWGGPGGVLHEDMGALGGEGAGDCEGGVGLWAGLPLGGGGVQPPPPKWW